MPVIQGHIQGVVPKDVPKDKPSPDVAFRNRPALIPFVQRQLKPIDRVARKENLARTFFVKAIQPGPDRDGEIHVSRQEVVAVFQRQVVIDEPGGFQRTHVAVEAKDVFRPCGGQVVPVSALVEGGSV